MDCKQEESNLKRQLTIILSSHTIAQTDVQIKITKFRFLFDWTRP
jgi:hypothetical protein